MLSSILRYLQRSKSKKQVKEIEASVVELHAIFRKLEKEIESLSDQRLPITNEQITLVKHYIATILDLNFPVVRKVVTHQSLFDKDLARLEEMVLHLQERTQTFLQSLPVIQENNDLQIQTVKKSIESFKKQVVTYRKDYFTASKKANIKSTYKAIYEFFEPVKQDSHLSNDIKGFLHYYETLDESVQKWNEIFIKKELSLYEKLFDNIDGKSLDQQQRTAIVTDEDHNLVLAGAGSGKTLTISGKVKYLVETKQVMPEEILLLSFTKKAADEMHERISKRLGLNVTVHTFHKLGLDILSKNRRDKPDVLQSMTSILDEYFHKEIYHHKSLIQKLMIFFGYYLNIPKDMDEFDDLGEYHEHYRNVDFETLKGKKEKMDRYFTKHTNQLKEQYTTYSGETVKSMEEFMIANFLFLNGISYQYEQPYPFHIENQEYRQYRPDFYLPEYDLYLEHFGINEKFKAPWLSKFEEEKYVKGISWKRETHRKYGTTLLETYSYYNKQGVLLEKLEELLKKHSVKFKQINYFELFTSIYDQTNDHYFTEFKKLIATFLNLFKSNGFDELAFKEFESQKNNLRQPFLEKRASLFFQIVKPIYHFYQEYLKEHKLVDFHDMINDATALVKEQKMSFPYKYIIIDEYQDISKSRFLLIKAIHEKTKAKIMCVGDDWQSIYRFAGSDVQLFTKFGENFGQYELLKIEKTYRNSQELINLAGDFVMKNPSQFKKSLTSDKSLDEPIRIIGYKRDLLDSLFQAIDEIVKSAGENSTVMLLGRNNFDIKRLMGERSFKIRENRSDGTKLVMYEKYPNLKITFLTAHRSKGLEAENVIILNGQNSSTGFPNKLSDDPLLSWVLTDHENYWFAEERRLFYVALTRTKNTTYILAPEQKQSTFVKELRTQYNIFYETNEKTVLDSPSCPRCKSGHLIIRQKDGSSSPFLGCTNFPGCDYTTKYVEVLQDPKRCPLCEGYMVKRQGRYGEFYGCSAYPRCEGKE
ncbi:UvrD-helicase domain-containing protein [Bacillus weihaiensis]|uniref:UvrD-helicase domain-containing protein n=1 Tax=Bacillus weihaiensis TaxID=1547283 RepID=UPI0023529010|nr:UvrD-helicase domain-containing protein [Bacillus weihaiensis]